MTQPAPEDKETQAKLNLDLLLACSMGLTERVKELVTQGADLFTTHSDGQTALHYAAAYGHEDLFEFCLEHNMPVDRKNAIGRTPLFNAVENSRTVMIDLLVKAGANPNFRDHEGKTPLHIAAQFGRNDSARALLAHAATSPLIRDNAGETALDISRHRSSQAVMREILQAISLYHARRIKQRYQRTNAPRP